MMIDDKVCFGSVVRHPTDRRWPRFEIWVIAHSALRLLLMTNKTYMTQYFVGCLVAPIPRPERHRFFGRRGSSRCENKENCVNVATHQYSGRTGDGPLFSVVYGWAGLGWCRCQQRQGWGGAGVGKVNTKFLCLLGFRVPTCWLVCGGVILGSIFFSGENLPFFCTGSRERDLL